MPIIFGGAYCEPFVTGPSQAGTRTLALDTAGEDVHLLVCRRPALTSVRLAAQDTPPCFTTVVMVAATASVLAALKAAGLAAGKGGATAVGSEVVKGAWRRFFNGRTKAAADVMVMAVIRTIEESTSESAPRTSTGGRVPVNNSSNRSPRPAWLITSYAT